MESYWSRYRRKRVSRRSVLGGAAAGAVGLGALAIAGCGDDDDESSSGGAVATEAATEAAAEAATEAAGEAATEAAGEAATEAATQAATATPTAAAATKDGSFYSEAVTRWANNPDLHREVNGVTSDHQIYSNLVVFGNVNAGTIIPDAAESLPEQPDEVTYIFKMRDGITWHDKAPANGSELTMDQVEWNIERNRSRMLSDGTVDETFHRFASVYSHIVDTEYTDDRTVNLTLSGVNGPWLGAMADQLNGFMHPEVAKAIEDNPGFFSGKNMVGTGPYMVTSFEQDRKFRLDRHPDHFRKKLDEPIQYVDQMIGTDIGDDINAFRAAFEQKQIDMFGGLFRSFPKQVMETIASANPDAELVNTADPNGNHSFLYNFNSGPFSIPQIREAFQLAIDRPLVIQQAFAGEGRPNPPIPFAYTGWTLPEDELLTIPGFRPDKTQDLTDARALWEAGGGPELGDIGIVIQNVPAGQAAAEWMITMINRNLGTDQFKAQFVEGGASLFNYLISDDYTIHFGTLAAWNQPDPRPRFALYFQKDGGINFGKYNNSEMEDLIARGFRSLVREEAEEIMRDAQRVALRDAGAGEFSIAGGLNRYMKWPYLHREIPNFTGYWTKDLAEGTWIDQSDPTFQGKPGIESL